MDERAGPQLVSPLQVALLPAATRARIRERYYDRFEEKHEGPWSWEYLLPTDDAGEVDDLGAAESPPTREAAEFLRIEGRDVLLPVGRDHHPYMRIERVIGSADDRHLVIVVTDTTYDAIYPDLGPHIFNDFLGVCVKLPGEDFYIAAMYHQWLPVALD